MVWEKVWNEVVTSSVHPLWKSFRRAFTGFVIVSLKGAGRQAGRTRSDSKEGDGDWWVMTCIFPRSLLCKYKYKSNSTQTTDTNHMEQKKRWYKHKYKYNTSTSQVQYQQNDGDWCPLSGSDLGPVQQRTRSPDEGSCLLLLLHQLLLLQLVVVLIFNNVHVSFSGWARPALTIPVTGVSDMMVGAVNLIPNKLPPPSHQTECVWLMRYYLNGSDRSSLRCDALLKLQ